MEFRRSLDNPSDGIATLSPEERGVLYRALTHKVIEIAMRENPLKEDQYTAILANALLQPGGFPGDPTDNDGLELTANRRHFSRFASILAGVVDKFGIYDSCEASGLAVQFGAAARELATESNLTQAEVERIAKNLRDAGPEDFLSD